MSKELAKPEFEVIFDNIRHPDVFSKVAESIQHHCKKNKLTTTFKDRNGNANVYPMVEAWQFTGALLGLFPRLVSTKDLSTGNGEKYDIIKFEATVEIVEQSTGKIVGNGVAICSNREKGKEYFQEYAVLSMAQTRATGKAFRLCLGWIMKAAGFEPAPAEEIEGYDDNQPSGITDKQLAAEYKAFALQSIKFCDKAAQISTLSKIGKFWHKDPQFIDCCKDNYQNLVNAGQ